MPTFDDFRDDNGTGFLHWVYRTRRGFAPLYACMLGWLIGLGLHLWVTAGDADPLLMLVGVGTSATILITATHHLSEDPRVAHKVTALAVFAALWLAVALWVPPWHPAMVWTWVLGVLIGAIAWWTNARLRSRVKAESMIDAWPRHAKSLHLDGSKMPRSLFRVTSSGWRAKITEVDSDVVMKQIGAIAAKYGLRRGRLEGKYTDRADVTELIYNERDANPGGTTLDEPEIDSIADEFVAGYQPNGKPFLLRLFDRAWGARHMLVAGMNGSGKSNFLNMIIAHIVKAKDAVPWLIDLKGGQEFGHWVKGTRGGGWLAVDKTEAVNMVREVIRVVETRARVSRRLWRSKNWKPSRRHPLICLIIDECAELTGDRDLQDALDKLKSVTRRARSCGVWLCYATQLPTNEAIGSTQIKSQMFYNICFRLKKKADARHVLNQYEGVDVSALPGNEPGNFYGEEAETEPIRARASHIQDDTILHIAEKYGREQSELDDETCDGLTDRFFERDRDPLEELSPEEFEEWFGMESDNRDGDDGDSLLDADLDGDGDDDAEQDETDGDGGTVAEKLARQGRGHRRAARGEGTGTARGDAGQDHGDTRPHGDGDTGTERKAGVMPKIDPEELFDDEFPPINTEARIAGVVLPDAQPPRERKKLTAEEIDAAWLKTLQDADIEGATPAQLAEATGLHRSTVHRRIEEWLETGRLERVRSGVYVLVRVGGRRAG